MTLFNNIKSHRVKKLDVYFYGYSVDKTVDALFKLNCGNMRVFHLFSCINVTNQILMCVARITLLENLCVRGCIGITDDGLLCVSGLQNLRKLEVLGVNLHKFGQVVRLNMMGGF